MPEHSEPTALATASTPVRVIRAAAPDDLFTVTTIFAHYVASTLITFMETAPTTGEWRQKLDGIAERGLPFLVAEEDGEIVGFAYASPWRMQDAYRYTVENSVYLAPGRTGRGLGRALLTALLAACEAAGVRQVVAVIADCDNDASPALHRRLGFRDAGRLTAVGHKRGHWLDTLLMQLDLSGGSARPGGLGVPDGALGPEGPAAGA
ncbi:GNAT family N-acetyltransferase [Streptomyces avicenniae]|uniref:GNAT family N-acetyltransferase n=1 Tax=Streptomyces avicenniae TaxID=500153 RepID=UPI00069C5F3D|nr:GNAT family N-acetyltransferase [Streptomyces avicenniae]